MPVATEPKVEYTGVPEAKPEMPRGLPQINVQVPHVQFTDAIGRAMGALGHAEGTLGDAVKSMGAAWSGAGNVLDKTGDELFRRAIALQEITNETATNEAISGYETEQGLADGNFTALKGNNAVGQYSKYLDDSKERRNRIRESLANDAQKRGFDLRSMAAQGRSFREASRHMGTEQKNAYINSLGADVEAWRRQVQNSPFDDELYESAQRGLKAAIEKKNQALGNDPKVAQVEIVENMEKLLADRLTKAADEQPFATWKNFQELKGQLSQPVRDSVEHSIKEKMRNSGALGAADKEMQDYMSGKPDETRSIKDRVDAAMAGLPDELKDDPKMRKNIQNEVETKIRDFNFERQQRKYNSLNTTLRILSGDESGGEIPKDWRAFIANPKGKEVWDGEDDIGREKIKEAIWQANIRAMRVDPITSDTNRRTWLGLALTDPSQFFEKMQDPTALFRIMNKEDRNYIRGLYERMLKDPGTNANVTKVEQWLKDAHGGTLVELGVDRLQKGKNDEDYYNFRGGILTALEEWMPKNQGKMPTREQFEKEIAPNILRWKPSSWYPWQWEEPPFWRGATPVPEDWEKERRGQIAGDRGIHPDDVPKEQIQRDYMHFLFRSSIEKREKAAPPPPEPPRPRRGGRAIVPTSGE